MSINLCIQKIRQANEQFGYKNPSGCDVKNISEIEMRCTNLLGQEIDPGYVELLLLSNGFEFNGFIIYSNGQVSQENNSFTGDFIEENLDLRNMNDGMKFKQIFGESDMDYYAKDMMTGEFQILSKYSNEVIKEFSSFEELICHGVEKYTT
jgi:hypothetical protein